MKQFIVRHHQLINSNKKQNPYVTHIFTQEEKKTTQIHKRSLFPSILILI